jgi:hypothetical protein
MKKNIKKTKSRIILVLFVLSFNITIYADNGIPTFKVSLLKTSINIGEPLVAELEYHFTEPQISNKKEVLKQIDPEAYLCIDKEDITIYQNRLPYKFMLELQDEAGLDYKGTFIIWYDVLGKKIFFDKPGEYIIKAGLSKEFLSNPVKIKVKSEIKKAQEALNVFKDLEDYLFLMFGLNQNPSKRDAILERLKQVQKQSEGTMLEKWSAARIGVECFHDLQYSTETKQSKIDEIQKYLNKGIELSDDFPVREETLYDLCNIESMKGNKNRADSLRDELLKKYPKGKFAEKYKTILANMGNNKEIVSQNTSAPSNNKKQIFIIIGLSLIAISMVIFIRKMKGKKI